MLEKEILKKKFLYILEMMSIGKIKGSNITDIIYNGEVLRFNGRNRR